MKWNWGYGIAAFYILFVLSLAYQLYRSMQYDRNLVVEDYYAKDLAYQEQFDRIENSLNEKVDIGIETLNGQLILIFPPEHIQPVGQLQFYRPDDQSRDILRPIILNEDQVFTMDASELGPGRWKIQASWSWEGKDYFLEKEWLAP